MRQQHCDLMDPCDKNRQAAVAAPTVRQVRNKSGVLVVDDEHMVRIMLQLGLERDGFDVWLATNGREAINLYREHREDIAVVLIDVCLPGLDGLQTLDALRELDPEIPACFMRGASHKPDELVQRGATDVITKPFFLDDLAKILRPLAH